MTPLGVMGDEPDGHVENPRPAWSAAAEISLVGVTAAAAIGLARLFSDGSFVVPVLIAVVFSHTAAAAGRHFGLPPTLAGLVSALAVLLVTALVVEPGSTTAGLPLFATWRALGHDLHEGWQRFGEVRAPTAVVPGFVAAAACGAGLAGAVADGLAFRARARFEALAPSFTLFMIGALLGSDQYRIATTALYLAAVLLFVLVSAPTARADQAWFSGRSGSGEASVLRGGLATGLAAMLIGLVIGPHLPGAHALGLVGVRDGSAKGSTSRVTVSPLVDIRNRLVDQSSTQLFTVETSVASYWRLTSLGRFDGTIWSSLGSYQPAAGDLPSQSQGSPGQPVYQRFSIQGLSSIWLPAAYRPQRFEGPKGIRYDADSSSLLTDAPSSDGLHYAVLSKPPALTAAQLATAGVANSGDLQRYLALPDGFPARVTALAADITRVGLTPYDKARALQDWFRSNFTYDLNVPAGHDESAIERFLFVTRRGYCEQFAGSYAAMARSIGLPARVAVGFTPGERESDGLFHVTGKEAHAWPEVFFPGYGWVAFEPTPGRAVPSGAAYTGVNPQSPGPAPAPAPSPATTPPATTPGPGEPTTQAPATTSPPTSAPATPHRASTTGGGSPIPLLALLAAVVVALLYSIGVPTARRSRRARLRAAATTPTARVIRSWKEAQEDLSLAGVRAGPSETAREFADRAGSGSGSDQMSRAMTDLADQWTAASYSPDGVGRAEADKAASAAEAVRSDLAGRATRRQRLVWLLDPRPLLKGRQA